MRRVGFLGAVFIEIPVFSENVVQIKVLHAVRNLIVELHARLGRVVAERNHGIVAVVLLHTFVGLLAVKRVPVSHINKGGFSVVVPVGDTIADHKALEIRLEDVRVLLVDHVVVVNLVDNVWDIDASIRLSGNVKIVVFKLRVLLEPLQYDDKVIIACAIIIEVAVFLMVFVIAP